MGLGELMMYEMWGQRQMKLEWHWKRQNSSLLFNGKRLYQLNHWTNWNPQLTTWHCHKHLPPFRFMDSRLRLWNIWSSKTNYFDKFCYVPGIYHTQCKMMHHQPNNHWSYMHVHDLHSACSLCRITRDGQWANFIQLDPAQLHSLIFGKPNAPVFLLWGCKTRNAIHLLILAFSM